MNFILWFTYNVLHVKGASTVPLCVNRVTEMLMKFWENSARVPTAFLIVPTKCLLVFL